MTEHDLIIAHLSKKEWEIVNSYRLAQPVDKLNLEAVAKTISILHSEISAKNVTQIHRKTA